MVDMLVQSEVIIAVRNHFQEYVDSLEEAFKKDQKAFEDGEPVVYRLQQLKEMERRLTDNQFAAW